MASRMVTRANGSLSVKELRSATRSGYACATGEAILAGPLEVAVASAAGLDDPLATAAWRHARGGSVIVAGEPDRAGVPLLAQRPLKGGSPTAYVCRGFVCDSPVTSVEELVRLL